MLLLRLLAGRLVFAVKIAACVRLATSSRCKWWTRSYARLLCSREINVQI
ncbi:MAG: hypothetical protein LBI56_01375 [Puniceicoccales bacterium]|nr:hypothetical protein [Puniceicoccales bacterium]